MVSRSRFSDPEQMKDSNLLKIASALPNFTESKMKEIQGEKPMAKDESNPLQSAGKFVEENAVKAVNGSNSFIQDGTNKMQKDDWGSKILGGLQYAGGSIAKLVSSVMGMLPTGIAKIGEMFTSVINNFQGKKSEEQSKGESDTKVASAPRERTSVEQPTPGNIPSSPSQSQAQRRT